MREILVTTIMAIVIVALAGFFVVMGVMMQRHSAANAQTDIEPYHIKLFEIRNSQYQVQVDGDWMTADQYLKQEFQNGYTVFEISGVRTHHQHRGIRLRIVTIHESVGD